MRKSAIWQMMFVAVYFAVFMYELVCIMNLICVFEILMLQFSCVIIVGTLLCTTLTHSAVFLNHIGGVTDLL